VYNTDLMLSILKRWLPFAFISTVLCALIYLSVQQDLRQSANDPQIQIAEDAVSDLKKGQTPANLVSSLKQIEMEESLAPFLIFYDESNKPVESSASLNGRIPSPPVGVFEFVKLKQSKRFTWEPKKGVREAAIMIKSSQGFVLSAKSLREIEKRDYQLRLQVGIAWIICLLSSLTVSSRDKFNG